MVYSREISLFYLCQKQNCEDLKEYLWSGGGFHHAVNMIQT
jgi:hypothetical protein